MRIRNRQGKVPVELNENLIVVDKDVANKYEHIEKDNTLSLVEESLHQLNDEQKQCVTLFYLEKKSYQEIAAITGYNLLQVKSFIQNGKRNLKQIVEKKLKQANG